MKSTGLGGHMFGHEEDNQSTAVSSATGNAGDSPNPAPPPISLNPSDQAVVDPLAAIAAEENAASRDSLSPAGGYPIPTSQKVKAGGSDDNSDTPEEILSITTGNDNLASIKIQALDELYPLIDKLDLTPEERFRTIMMMIQASDNQELIQAAYEAAHTIEDEKTKAQALLDIVNEINYFTQHAVK